MGSFRTGDEAGAALLLALLTAVLLAAIAAALVHVTTAETLIAAAHRHAEEASNAADAALDLAVHDLATLADWSLALAPPPANLMSSFADGRQIARAPDGRRLDLARLAAERQRDSDAEYGPGVFGADSPQWRLYLHTPLNGVLPSGSADAPAYLVAWVADDGGDGDADPAIDSNVRVLVFAEAYGSGGARRAIEAAVGRAANGAVQVVGWRSVKF